MELNRPLCYPVATERRLPMTNMNELSLGKRIQALRKQQGLTQEALAEKMSVSPQAVSKWENDLSCPDVMSLPRLAQQLDVSIDMLLTGVSPGAAPAQPAKKPEELIVRMAIQEEDGTRVCVNLPFIVFRLSALHGMLSVTYDPADGSDKVDLGAMAALSGLDLPTIARMIESGVTGKIVDIDSDGEKLLIWTE